MSWRLPHKEYNITRVPLTLTATWDSRTFTNPGYTRAHIYVNVTAASGTSPTLTPRLQAQDPVSGVWHTIAQAPALTGVSSHVIAIAPGLTETDDIDPGVTSVNGHLPSRWRVELAIGGTTPSFTVSVGAAVAQ